MVNEIDEIFASKPTLSSKPATTENDDGSSTSTLKKDGKRSIASVKVQVTSQSSKKKKRKRQTAESSNLDEEWSGIGSNDTTEAKGKTSNVEVIDASKRMRVEVPKPPKKTKASTKNTSKADDEDALFKDSRGTGPR
jgi:hypothetical protein